jgi:hypothetical protein
MSNMKLVNGVLTEMTAAEITQRELDIAAYAADLSANGYKTARASAYPTIQEQLDMQYWDGVNGTTIWADTIAQIKSENPKP